MNLCACFLHVFLSFFCFVPLSYISLSIFFIWTTKYKILCTTSIQVASAPSGGTMVCSLDPNGYGSINRRDGKTLLNFNGSQNGGCLLDKEGRVRKKWTSVREKKIEKRSYRMSLPEYELLSSCGNMSLYI